MSQQCRDAFKKFAGSAFDDADVDRIVDSVTKKARQKFDQPGMDPATSISDIIDELTVEELKEFAVRKRMAAKDKLADVVRDIEWNKIDAEHDGKRLQKLIEIVDRRGEGLAGKWQGDMLRALKAEGLDVLLGHKAFRKPDAKLDRDIYIEMARLNGAKDAPTGNKDAARIAEIMTPYVETARLSLNDVGAFIGKIPGYVFPQGHDGIKVSGGFFKGLREGNRAQAKNDWIDWQLARLDHDVTFDGVKDKRAFLEAAWGNIVAGRHETQAGVQLDGALAQIAPPVGQSSLARRVSRERVLHYKSAADAYDNLATYGRGTVMDGVFRHITKTANNVELMRLFGPNPSSKFEALTEGIKQANPAERKLGLKQRRKEFDEITGAALETESVRVTGLVASIKTFNNVTKLGKIVISSMSDTSILSDVMNRAGVPVLKSYDAQLKALTKLESKDQKLAAEMLNTAANYMAGSNTARFAESDGASAFLARRQQDFYKVNVFNYQQTKLRNAGGYVYARHLGELADTSWARLGTKTQNTLKSYGFDRAGWELVRKYAGTTADDLGANGKMLFPDDVDNIPASAIKSWGKKQGIGNEMAARNEMLMRVESMYQDLANRALTTPNAVSNAKLRWGKRGTAVGAAMDMFLQFKQFPINIMTQHISPHVAAIKSAGLSSAAIKPTSELAFFIVQNAILGYLAMQTKQLVAGKTFVPLNGKTAMAGLLQGGGLGIYGDFLFADYNRFGGSVLESMAGPTYGNLTEFMQFSQALFNEDVNAGPKAVKLVKGNIPFGNLFYTQAALDYLILFQMQEWASPGSLKRMEKRMERERGQRYIVPPSEYKD